MAGLRGRIEVDSAVALSVAAGMVSPVVAKVTRRVLTRAEISSPVDKGIMRVSHSMSMRVTKTSVVGRVVVGAEYAVMVHEGTAPHTIKAKRAQALSFNWAKVGGARVVVPKGGGKGPTGLRKTKKGVVFYIAKGYVRHPGTKPRPWLFRSLKEVATLADFKVTQIHPGGTA